MNIIVAGAGHGGLTAAYLLAKAGHEVYVIEKRKQSEIGHDWHDSMSKTVIEDCGLPAPKPGTITEPLDMGYYNPKRTVQLVTPVEGAHYGFADRKLIIRHLIKSCRSAGVRFSFGTEIIHVLIEDHRVAGLTAVSSSGKTVRYFSDLLIDAAGANSPVRTGLPTQFGIRNTLNSDELFKTYRAYYKRTGKGVNDPRYNVFFYHCGKPGMDWVIEENHYYDILVGGFGSLSEDDVAVAIDDFKTIYTDMEDEIVRGGQYTDIPLRKTLPVFIADGYAAVGDSACMTEPLSGSGINLSIRAGKILADKVIEANDSSADTLWKYNREYITKIGAGYMTDAVISKLLGKLNHEQVDAMLEGNILTVKELSGGRNYKARELLQKLEGFAKSPSLVPIFLGAVSPLTKTDKILKAIPVEYDIKKVIEWAESYEQL